jgi:hypothetical protein
MGKWLLTHVRTSLVRRRKANRAPGDEGYSGRNVEQMQELQERFAAMRCHAIECRRNVICDRANVGALRSERFDEGLQRRPFARHRHECEASSRSPYRSRFGGAWVLGAPRSNGSRP